MKIAFWSNSHNKCGATANLAAISVAGVLRFPYKIMTFENRLCHKNLGQAYLGTPSVEMRHEVGTNYYDGGGMEGLLRRIYRGDYSTNIIPKYWTEIVPDHLYYLPQSGVIHSELFDYELNHGIYNLFQLTEQCSDFCFIDTAYSNNLSTKTILEEADLIVVNLCQNDILIEDFFLNYSSLIPKAIIIIGNYTIQSNITMRKICHKHNLPFENITMIPFNELYHNAIHTGDVKEFILRNYRCQAENPNHLFIQAVKKAAYMIIRRAEELQKQNRKETNSVERNNIKDIPAV